MVSADIRQGHTYRTPRGFRCEVTNLDFLHLFCDYVVVRGSNRRPADCEGMKCRTKIYDFAARMESEVVRPREMASELAWGGK